MAADDDEFLDDVFDRALDALTDGRSIDAEAWATQRPELRPQVEAAVRLALEVAAPRLPGFPAVPGYQVVAELGRGGMGTVFLARQERLGGRLVALKVLSGAGALSERGRARFLDEAKTLARLRHEHVVTVHDVVEAPALCAYAMEWVDGRSLASLLEAVPGATVGASPTAENGAATPEVFFCRIALQIARALGAVHDQGLVHRDVKPSNIMVREDGRAVLVDFGLARPTDATITAGFAGTLAYAAPEQLAGAPEEVSARGDVYGLGATLYHALARRRAFDGSSAAALARAIDAGAPALRRHNPRVSRDLDTIVATAMASDPARRYPSAHALADDLERLLSLQPIAARPAGLATRAVMLLRRNRRAVAGAVAGGVLALLLAGLAIGYVLHRAGIPARVRAHVEAARLSLLSAEHGERLFVALHLPGQPTENRLDGDAVGRALAEYAAALALAPDDVAIQRERAAVAVARDLGAGVAGEAPTDRRALGLLAYLRGDAAQCSRAWEGLDLGDPTDPLIDAALGELHLQRDEPALAYPRLEAAARAFPTSGFVRVQLAAAALRCGDVERAGRLLDAAAAMSGHDRFDSLTAVRAEWHAARGDHAEARERFEWMRVHHQVPAVRARYARWLAGREEHVAALTVLGEAIEHQPTLVSFRRHHVELVERWWGGLGVEGKRRWLTELAARGDESWTLAVLRRYADSVARLTEAPPDAIASGNVAESTIASSSTASPKGDRRFLLDLVSTLEASPVTLARCPSDTLFVRTLQVSAWMSTIPTMATFGVGLLRRAHMAIRTILAPVALLACQLGGLVSPGYAQGCVSLPGGAVSWWPGDGETSDVVGSNAAALLNGATFAAGRVGQGFAFDGVDDVVHTPLVVSYASGATFEAWVRLTNDRGAIMAGGGGATAEFGMGLFIEPGGLLQAFGTRAIPDHNNFRIFGPSINDGLFHHVALTWTGDTTPDGVAMYLDGSLIGTSTAGTSLVLDSRVLNLGGHAQGYYKLQGVIDEPTVYSRALTPTEIAAIYAAGSAGKCRPDLVDPTQTSIDASAPLVSAFGGQATITVTPKNHSGGILAAGQSVLLSTSAGTLLGSVTDNADGTYTQILQAAPAAPGAVISATVNGIAITDAASVTFIPIDPTQSTITASPDTTFLGGHATITVTPKDDQGIPVGAGKAVVIQTTLGALVGSVTDNQDGTYTQRVNATAVGTAAITATAEGLPLTSSAALTILDSSLGRVIGLRADQTALPYDTIQRAVNNSGPDQLTRILVNPGTYDELVLVRDRHGLSFEGLSAMGLVTVRGFRISQSSDVTIASFDVDASSNARHGIKLLGAGHANARITVHDCMVHGTRGNFDGIRIGRDNCDVVLRDLWLENNAGDGIYVADGPCGVTITRATILASGQIGIRCADQATVRIESCRIEDSGVRLDGRQGYAIFRQRRHDGGNPAAITLVANTFAGNRGRVVAGKSDANLGNYDQVLDATDSQPGY